MWTQQMINAWSISSQLHDHVAARMAFIDAYKKEVAIAGAPEWQFSGGTNSAGRAACLREALRKKQITRERALALCPLLEAPAKAPQLPSHEDHGNGYTPEVKALLAQTMRALTHGMEKGEA